MKSTKERKTDVIKNVSGLSLSKKENNLFQKILEKGLKKWNDNDVEFLTLLYDIHLHPVLHLGGMDIYPHEQEIKIKNENRIRQENAFKRLSEEPYSLWFKNARNYK